MKRRRETKTSKLRKNYVLVKVDTHIHTYIHTCIHTNIREEGQSFANNRKTPKTRAHRKNAQGRCTHLQQQRPPAVKRHLLKTQVLGIDFPTPPLHQQQNTPPSAIFTSSTTNHNLRTLGTFPPATADVFSLVKR